MTNRRPFILTTYPPTMQVQFFDGETYDLRAPVETLPQLHELCIPSGRSRTSISIAYQAGW